MHLLDEIEPLIISLCQIPDPEMKRLVIESVAARKKAYSPYSKFTVGAALLCKDGTIIQGCNVENISLGLTICAERTAGIYKPLCVKSTECFF